MRAVLFLISSLLPFAFLLLPSLSVAFRLMTNVAFRLKKSAPFALFALAFAVSASVSAQSGRRSDEKKGAATPTPTPQLLERTTTPPQTRRPGFGGLRQPPHAAR